MPGPLFSTPRSVSPSVPRKRFTVAQANTTLPLKRVVADLVRVHKHALELQEEIQVLDESKDSTIPQKELDAATERLADYVGELSDIGCDLKDYKTGLIDFIGRHQGRDVCLCWKLGEDKIGYWHETTAGAAGRKADRHTGRTGLSDLILN